MKFTDMDMLQDYEKDARMATLAYALIQTEILDNPLRILLKKASDQASESQLKVTNLIIKRGDRP